MYAMKHICVIARKKASTVPSRLQIAKADIKAFFDAHSPHVLKLREIAKLLSEQSPGWRLAKSTTTNEFIDFLAKNGLERLAFAFPNGPETLYVWGQVPLLEAVLYLNKRSYFSHYTAMQWHGLTEQLPKVLYISHERPREVQASELDQEAIDAAFKRPPRVSKNTADLKGRRIILINSAFSDEKGVISQEVLRGSPEAATVRMTNLERTLIDAAVRPFYSGGTHEVGKAFQLAHGRVSVNTLCAMLKQLGYAYPYHQAIGYYMERAGYSGSQLDLLRRFPQRFDFYLTHEMVETTYVEAWRLFVPKGF